MLIYLYNFLFYLIQPFIWLRILFRAKKLRAYRERLAERYGFCQGKVIPKGILIHAVSVGETLAAVPLVQALRHRFPHLPLTFTTTTPTGSARAVGALGNSVSHVYFPYDLPCAVNRFLKALDPVMVIVMETELWPNVIDALHRQKIPLIMANARLSPRSVEGYKKLGNFIRQRLNRVTLVAAQSKIDANHFIELGLEPSKLVVTGNLKFDIPVPKALMTQAQHLRQQWARHRPVWIAASTHEGEEEIILHVHQRLLQDFSDLLLILVPRHPQRFAHVQQIAEKKKFSVLLRSKNIPPSLSTQVIIGNTMGELLLLYGIADVAYVGGSLIEKGGHNPLEPAAHSLPIIVGPYMFNFAEIAQKLQDADALLTITNANTLYDEIKTLLKNDRRRHYFGQNAKTVLKQNQGALTQLLYLIEHFLPIKAT